MKATRARSVRSSTTEPSNVKRIALESIDWSFAIRPISMDHVERLAAATQLPPIKVWEFQVGQYRGVDGYHRWRLAQNRGERQVEASVIRFPPGQGGERAFEFECVRSNLQHGLPLTRDQRDRAIVRIWNRWGRKSQGSETGMTLDQLGKLFNLTKPRIHQIITSKAGLGAESASEVPYRSDDPEMRRVADVGVHRRPIQAHPGGFSSFGRFSSATARFSRLLEDEDFVGKLFRERNPDVFKVLVKLRGLIDNVLAAKAPVN